jgi:aryl-phospho-beta-D-glucosidase BglC (GH1 family)
MAIAFSLFFLIPRWLKAVINITACTNTYINLKGNDKYILVSPGRLTLSHAINQFINSGRFKYRQPNHSFMKKTLSYFLCILAIPALTRCTKPQIASPDVKPLAKTSAKAFAVTSYPSYNISPLAPDQTGMTSTATQIAANMTLGINIGNTLEAQYNENAWGNPNITQALIDSYKQKGFNAIRIPCNWNWSHVPDSTTAKIDPAWLARVQQVVQYCVNDGMYAILNIHYDGGWLENNCTTTAQAAVNAKQKALWEQIATQMRGFDQHLIFASANEPNSATDTTGMRVLLSYHQTFINAVRSTGGHNSYRTLVIQGPKGGDMVYTNNLMNTMPTDPASNRLMVEIHNYTPWNFCLMDADASWGNAFYYWGAGYHTTFDVAHNPYWGEESTLSGYFQTMKTKFVDHGIPVIMGEFAVMDRNLAGDSLNFNLASRAYWYNFCMHQASANGIHPFLWDTGSLINRSTYAVKDQRDLAALVQGAQTGASPAFQVGGVYQIINRYSFKPLEIQGWGTANGSLADQWDYLAGPNQQFKVQAAANGSYLLTPMHVSGKCLEVWGWSGSNGGAVDMWDYTGTGGANQNWLIQPTYDGFYKIINVNSGKALEVTLGTDPAVPFRNGSAVDQFDYYGGKNQQWGFVKI